MAESGSRPLSFVPVPAVKPETPSRPTKTSLGTGLLSFAWRHELVPLGCDGPWSDHLNREQQLHSVHA